MNQTPQSGMRLRRSRRRVRGVAAVELALCLPILLTITWMTIVACSLIHLRHSLTLAAYEGARTAIVKGATNADVTEAADWVLGERGVTNAAVTISAPDITQVIPGQYISVTASATANANMPLAGFTGGSIQATSEMMKEY